MTRQRKEEIAEMAAGAFAKVAAMNAGGINGAWVAFWAKSADGIFLRPCQARTIAAQAAAIIAVSGLVVDLCDRGAK